MPFEKFEDADAIDKERRKPIVKSIRIISVEELKKLGEEMFDDPDRPWRQTALQFVAEHPGATFYYASAGDGVISFTLATQTKTCGICPAAAWGRCRWQAGS